MDGDEAGLLIIKEVKDLFDVLTGISIVHLLGQQAEPLLEIDSPVSVGIKVGDHLEDGSAFGFKAERSHCCFEL